jgi:hypothetical protein
MKLPLGSNPTPELAAEARRIIAGGLGKAEIEFISSITAPIFWILQNEEGRFIRSGTFFVLDTGERIFGVTAGHVIQQCFRHMRTEAFQGCNLGGMGRSIPVEMNKRIIDANAQLDIGTFHVTREEAEHIGRTVLTGFVKNWPPIPVLEGRGVTYCGFPGVGRTAIGPRDIDFNGVTASGIATGANESVISILIERQHLVAPIGESMLPENYDFRGISGGPVLAIIETDKLRSWMPAGVIFQGPNTSGDPNESIPGFELIRARPIQYIHADGTLDNDRWAMNNMHRSP